MSDFAKFFLLSSELNFLSHM